MSVKAVGRGLRFVSLAAAVVAMGAIFGQAQARGQSAAPAAEIWKGVYTAAQAEAGETSYTAMCSRCHNPDLSGGQIGAQAPALGGDHEGYIHVRPTTTTTAQATSSSTSPRTGRRWPA